MHWPDRDASNLGDKGLSALLGLVVLCKLHELTRPTAGINDFLEHIMSNLPLDHENCRLG